LAAMPVLCHILINES